MAEELSRTGSVVPTVGRIVTVFVNPETNNGSDTAPAMITRVWSEPEPGVWVVNYQVLPDAPDTFWVTSAKLYPDRDTAEAVGGYTHVAFWPSRT